MWDAFKDLIFQIIQFFYNFCGDWGLAIIIVTVIFRVLISPLMHKQTKSSFQMQKVQPLKSRRSMPTTRSGSRRRCRSSMPR